jgi:hypothetical protein
LSDKGVKDPQSVGAVTLGYTDPEGEKLIVFTFGSSGAADPTNVPFPLDAFLIPPAGRNFETGACTYTGSPLRSTTCGTSGGSRICNF